MTRPDERAFPSPPSAAEADASALSSQARSRSIAEMAREPLDVLVVGGGVVGAGAALDAATRGLSVGLIEANDYAYGSSSRSTKLIHGGLRYLEMLDFKLVHEALTERGLLLERIAPHLVGRLPFVLPLERRVFERAYVAAGLAIYDALALSTRGGRGVPRQHQLSRRALYAMSPGLKHDRFIGGIEYYDAQVDDARLVVHLARTAAAFGARVANRCELVGFLRDGGRVSGATVRDRESGEEFAVIARSVVLATGVWTEQAVALAGHASALRVSPSKGVHLSVARDAVQLGSALVTRTEKSVLFVIPWRQQWLIGTTDTPWPHDPERPVATETDVSYLLTRVNEVLETPLTKNDVMGVTAGLRPLISQTGRSTDKLSREHAIGFPSPGLVVISGGKYTTYRVMAKDVIDAVLADGETTPIASQTASTPLVGAAGFVAYRAGRDRIATRAGISIETTEHLLSRYGTRTEEVLAQARLQPSLLQPLAAAPSYLRAEVAYAVSHEGALHADDVLRRRLRLDLESADEGLSCLSEVVEVMGDMLAWPTDRRSAEVAQYRRVAMAERQAEQLRDDAAASASLERSLGQSPTERGRR